ncbi:Uu.00g033850.m01.CDS01 [Anthostomella pinea]|uniref:Uu.00g033850.m01.CDS01 n=1 Tax=Anthostomella pinea TaxID=933095 RepID=A0AAI8V9J7_9PEZI|nr:Uu.00g033850.m01.CDS01 [Anthostomella pinea]
MGPRSYNLYHHPYSVCSIMVRYTLALAGEPRDTDSAMDIEEKVIDIFHNAQLDEEYLCNVNPKGQVPVLKSSSLVKPLPDSVAITHFIAEHYPALFPAAHAPEITRLLKELHRLNFFSLCFGNRPQVAQGFVKALHDRLGREDITKEYRRALEYKLSVTQEEKVKGVDSDTITHTEQRARAVVKELETLLVDGQPWLFGSKRPSALDAHFVVFLRRMRDVKREDLLSRRLIQYCDEAMTMPEWEKVMEGRKTMVAA